MTDETPFEAEDFDLIDDESAPISVNRWQYPVVKIGMFNAPDRLARILGELGSQGWELVQVYDKASNWLSGMEKGFAIFKRPVVPGASPEGPWASWTRASAGRELPPDAVLVWRAKMDTCEMVQFQSARLAKALKKSGYSKGGALVTFITSEIDGDAGYDPSSADTGMELTRCSDTCPEATIVSVELPRSR